jgi:hypothetical protein
MPSVWNSLVSYEPREPGGSRGKRPPLAGKLDAG